MKVVGGLEAGPGSFAGTMIQIVIESWKATYQDPIIVNPGERVSVGRRDTEWTDFLWCRSSTGLAGWIPASILEPDGRGRALVLSAYDARELTVGEGDRVRTIASLAEWTWCEAADGRTGWVPDRCLADPR
jgi:hypothetical protein